jgi:putative endonuclease
MSWPGNPGHPGDTAPMPNTYYVYILASKRNGTLYIGVTNDLARQLGEHREGLVPGFTKRYGVTRLVHYEIFDDIYAAIHRETRMKKYKREWKLNLIQQNNEEWKDLAESL